MCLNIDMHARLGGWVDRWVGGRAGSGQVDGRVHRWIGMECKYGYAWNVSMECK